MATRNLNLIREWVEWGGRVIFENNNITVIKDENNGEWLIAYNEWIIHVIPGKMIVVLGKRRYVSSAPRWRGNAIRFARNVMANIPEWIRQQIPLSLPL